MIIVIYEMILTRVKEYIEKNSLLREGQTIVVGVSGGADSVALLDILHALGYKCIIAHCNFHLRGEESGRDEMFVTNLAEQYGLALHKVDFDTIGYAKEKSVSIEMAARELRYDWFENLSILAGADEISVAHHSDDSVETILLNLVRGTGIRGLVGISPRNGNIVRPLLCINRKEVVDYLNERKIPFIVDSTNNENIYSRNKIRLDILPLFETINPSAKNAILKTSFYLSQVENIYNDYINKAKSTVLEVDKINIEKLNDYIEPEALLYEILAEYGFNSAIVHQIFESLDSISGKIFYSDSYQIVKDRDYLLLKKLEGITGNNSYTINESDIHISSPIRFNIEITDISSDFKIEKNKHTLYLDADMINFPLVLRKWRQGDWFIPYGMTGRKKISDYFSDHKFSLLDKQDAWLLCAGDNILWIVGERSDNRYKVTESTEKVVKIVLDK